MGVAARPVHNSPDGLQRESQPSGQTSIREGLLLADSTRTLVSALPSPRGATSSLISTATVYGESNPEQKLAALQSSQGCGQASNFDRFT